MYACVTARCERCNGCVPIEMSVCTTANATALTNKSATDERVTRAQNSPVAMPNGDLVEGPDQRGHRNADLGDRQPRKMRNGHCVSSTAALK